MAVDISIVIPCYNSGEYLPEAIESVKRYAGIRSYEIILIDDGSTEDATLRLLNHYHLEGINVIHQTNKGPAAARNTGVTHSRSEYILFLDSDNKIYPEYIDEAISILETQPATSVIYSNNDFFGEADQQRFTTGAFDLPRILLSNYIDMCSVIRKKMWEKIGGLDENRILIGHEDWEFWIRAGAEGYNFFHIDKELFSYRIRHDSLITQAAQPEKFERMKDYVYKKHYKTLVVSLQELMSRYEDVFRSHASIKQIYERDQNMPIRSFAKYFYRKHFA